MSESWKAGGSPPAARNSTFVFTYGERRGSERSQSVVSFSGQAELLREAERFAECRERDAEDEVVHELHGGALPDGAEVENALGDRIEDRLCPLEVRGVSAREDLDRPVGGGLHAARDGDVAEADALLERARGEEA